MYISVRTWEFQSLYNRVETELEVKTKNTASILTGNRCLLSYLLLHFRCYQFGKLNDAHFVYRLWSSCTLHKSGQFAVSLLRLFFAFFHHTQTLSLYHTMLFSSLALAALVSSAFATPVAVGRADKRNNGNPFPVGPYQPDKDPMKNTSLFVASLIQFWEVELMQNRSLGHLTPLTELWATLITPRSTWDSTKSGLNWIWSV